MSVFSRRADVNEVYDARHRDMMDRLKVVPESPHDAVPDDYGIRNNIPESFGHQEHQDFERRVDECLAVEKDFLMKTYEFKLGELRRQMEEQIHAQIKSICTSVGCADIPTNNGDKGNSDKSNGKRKSKVPSSNEGIQSEAVQTSEQVSGDKAE